MPGKQFFITTSLLAAAASVAWGTDIPAEIADTCSFFGYCGPAATGLSGTFSHHSGNGALTSWSTSPAGTFSAPWLLAVDLAGTEILRVDGSLAGGPLRSPSDLNPTGTQHVTGRYFSLLITNTGPFPVTRIRLDLELTPGIPSSQIDSLSFADAAPGDPNDLFPFFSSITFPIVGRVPETQSLICSPLDPDICLSEFLPDAITFEGGYLPPGATASLLFAITNGDHAGSPDHFYLTVAPTAVPEPGTVLFAVTGLAALAIGYRLRRNLRPTD